MPAPSRRSPVEPADFEEPSPAADHEGPSEMMIEDDTDDEADIQRLEAMELRLQQEMELQAADTWAWNSRTRPIIRGLLALLVERYPA